MATQTVSVTKVTIRGGFRYRVNYVSGGKRVRQLFDSKSQAEAEAVRVREAFAAFGASWLTLPASERSSLIQAWQRAKSNGVDLLELASVKRSAGASVTLEAAVTELCAAKKNAGRAGDYVNSLRLVLKKFIRGRETLKADAVTLSDVEAFLDAHSLAYRSTLRARISTLFKFAVRRGYCPGNPCGQLEPVTYNKPSPSVFTPEQARICLDWLRLNPRGMVWFVLTTFCGLRPDEARKTARESIDLDAGTVTVDSQTTKVRQRRIVTPMDEAMRLLREALDLGGKTPIPKEFKRRLIYRLRTVLDLDKWPKDITRHSAASYWLSVKPDAAFVAEQLGNSESVLKRDYKALVTKSKASEFWSLSNDA